MASRFYEVRDRLGEVETRIAEIHDRHVDRQFPADVREEWNALNAERDELAERVKRERRVELLAQARNDAATERAAPPVVGRLDDDPWTRRSGSSRDRAKSAVEQLHRSSVIGDGGATLANRLVSGASPRADMVRSWMLAASDPAYESAFYKVLANPATGHRSFSARELDAFQTMEERAMALDPDTAGGALSVPFALDPTITLASDGSVDPFRQVARTVTIAGTDTWKGVSSDGVVASWYGEAVEVSDDSPSVDSPEIPTHRASAYAQFSIELDQDVSRLRSELGRLFADAKTQLEATAFTGGTGSGQPTGVVSALGASETVTTAAADYGPDDAYGIVEAVPPRFRPRMRVLANLATINATRRFTTDTEPEIVPSTYDRWLGRPLHETSTLDDAVETGNVLALAGDFSRYVIVDRIGMAVELVPHVFGTNRRPTGERGLFAHWRVGADALVANALRKLVVG